MAQDHGERSEGAVRTGCAAATLWRSLDVSNKPTYPPEKPSRLRFRHHRFGAGDRAVDMHSRIEK